MARVEIGNTKVTPEPGAGIPGQFLTPEARLKIVKQVINTPPRGPLEAQAVGKSWPLSQDEDSSTTEDTDSNT